MMSSNAIDKAALLGWLGDRDVIHSSAMIMKIFSGAFDLPEPTVTLGDGTEAKVGDKVKYAPVNSTWKDVKLQAIYGEACWIWSNYDGYKTCNANSLKAYKEPEPEDSWKKLEADLIVATDSCDSRTESCEKSCERCAFNFIERAKALAGKEES